MKNVSLGIVVAALAVSAPRLTLAFLIGDGIHIPESVEITILAVTGVGSGIVLTVGNAVLAHALAAKAHQRGALWWLNALAWLLFLLGAVVLVAPTLVAGLHHSTLATVLNTPNARWVWSVVAVVIIELLVGAAMAAAILADESQPPSVQSGPSRWGRLLDAATARATRALAADTQEMERTVSAAVPHHSNADGSSGRAVRLGTRPDRPDTPSGSNGAIPDRTHAGKDVEWNVRSDTHAGRSAEPFGSNGVVPNRTHTNGEVEQNGGSVAPFDSNASTSYRTDTDGDTKRAEHSDLHVERSNAPFESEGSAAHRTHTNGETERLVHSDARAGRSAEPFGSNPSTLQRTDIDGADSELTGPANGANRTRARSKKEALERCLHVWRTNPRASLAEVGQLIGRRKSTVSTYRRELERQQRIRVDEQGGVVVLQPA